MKTDIAYYTTLWKKREDWKEYPVHGNIYWKKRYIREEKREFDTSFFSVLLQSLYLSHLWLIFLLNFVNFIVLLCTLCGIIEKTDFFIGEKRYVYIYHWK